ncbi:MAG: helix-turn-helix domain-containing protein [Pseudomonas sp.]|uniref:winged helix-turn-helix transcriptional regulator n=1 Tax=Pseudomonas sp. TaxID=306 RepID=UPI003BB665A4
MAIIGGAWTPNIIWYLSQQPRRFTELKVDIPEISAKILSARLKKLEADGVVIRQVLSTSPPSVEYSLSVHGQELMPAIEAIANVGHRLKALALAQD